MNLLTRCVGARALRCLTLYVFVAGPAVLISGCGDDSGGSSLARPGAAELQCRNLTEEVCEMWVDCDEMAAGDYLGCVELLDAELDCDLARDTSFMYSTCMDHLSSGCFPPESGMPATCTGVILM